jgi:high affinity Mn2+ porin
MTLVFRRAGSIVAGMLVASAPAVMASADDRPATPEDWALHAQATFVDQYHSAFRSPYQGPNSLGPKSVGDETFDLTLFVGLRPWDGGELWIDPEVDQGFGLSNTLGVAAFPSAEAYKVGKAEPYFRLQRLFFRQTFDLGGDSENIDAAANQLRGTHTANNLVFTAGKFSVTDIFDTNSYAHDPKSDFLNWAIVDSGSFDYAADAWGYSYGGDAEWTQDWWTLRADLFDLSRVPNSTKLQRDFNQFEAVAEAEERHSLFGRPGKLKLLGFVNRGRMGSYADALARARETGGIPDTALVRHYNSKAGFVLNGEQQIVDDLGAFVRLSFNDGSKEAYEFTEINKSLAAGLSLKATAWSRPKDIVGAAFAIDGLSRPARDYFAAGGLGILIGDGKLPHYGSEYILETYYSAAVTDWLNLSADYQFIANPAYNRDRGPVSVIGGRIHAAM